MTAPGIATAGITARTATIIALAPTIGIACASAIATGTAIALAIPVRTCAAGAPSSTGITVAVAVSTSSVPAIPGVPSISAIARVTAVSSLAAIPTVAITTVTVAAVSSVPPLGKGRAIHQAKPIGGRQIELKLHRTCNNEAGKKNGRGELPWKHAGHDFDRQRIVDNGLAPRWFLK
ncbi:hypothetical protein [Microvirga guangxiensis]|uniref:hypothetical protein n=1 Tax=Microvirga guangxiensis TaxID=549386 RepID=UPI0011133BB9|nr:hypothetical protein [Microvirga guangxiensis]